MRRQGCIQPVYVVLQQSQALSLSVIVVMKAAVDAGGQALICKVAFVRSCSVSAVCQHEHFLF